MNKKNLIKIINNELLILTTLIEGFNEEGDINDKEIALTISKVKDIYDVLILLKSDESNLSEKTDISISNNEETTIQKADKTDNVLEDINSEIIELIQEQDTIKDIEEVEEPEEKKNEEKMAEETVDDEAKEKIKDINIEQEEENIITKKETEREEEIKDIPEEKNYEKKIIADTFTKNKPSLNDMLSNMKSNKNLASILKDGPIVNLKSAIKLNDRIWYIKELFGGNSVTYEKTIDSINNSNNLDEALNYLVANFNWDQSKKSTITFLELIFRRFANK